MGLCCLVLSEHDVSVLAWPFYATSLPKLVDFPNEWLIATVVLGLEMVISEHVCANQ